MNPAAKTPRARSSATQFLEELDSVWADTAAPSHEGFENREDRVARLRGDFLGWGRYYLPHYFRLDPSKMHRELAAELMRVIASPESEHEGIAAPRANAKTTLLVRAFTLFCIVYDLKWFLVLVTSVASMANDYLADVKNELENNELLRADFPHACGRGRVWRDNVVVTRNGIKFQVFGAGGKIRGRTHGARRPDLVLVDDLENDDHIRSKEQRDKTQTWLTKAALNLEGVGEKCDYIVSGTLLHFDSVLSRIVNRREPFRTWRTFVYKAVIAWASRQDLWQ